MDTIDPQGIGLAGSPFTDDDEGDRKEPDLLIPSYRIHKNSIISTTGKPLKKLTTKRLFCMLRLDSMNGQASLSATRQFSETTKSHR